jgi:hypothetical protein
MNLTAIALKCTLKPSPQASSTEKLSTEKLLRQLLDAVAERAVDGEIVRAVDFNIKPGVSSDEGEGDAWPDLRRRILA